MPRKRKRFFKKKKAPTEEKKEAPVNEVSCPDCKWKAGLSNNGKMLCKKCNGTGLIVAKPLA